MNSTRLEFVFALTIPAFEAWTSEEGPGPRGLPASVPPPPAPGKAEPSHTIPVRRVESLFSPSHAVRIWGKRAAGEISKPNCQQARQSPSSQQRTERR